MCFVKFNLKIDIQLSITATVTQPLIQKALDNTQENKTVCVCLRAELSACESHYLALRSVNQALQAEILGLYSKIPMDTHDQPQDASSR